MIFLTIALYLGAYAIFVYVPQLWWLGIIIVIFAVLLSIRVAAEIIYGEPSSN